jgi:hypothetical protein
MSSSTRPRPLSASRSSRRRAPAMCGRRATGLGMQAGTSGTGAIGKQRGRTNIFSPPVGSIPRVAGDSCPLIGSTLNVSAVAFVLQARRKRAAAERNLANRILRTPYAQAVAAVAAAARAVRSMLHRLRPNSSQPHAPQRRGSSVRQRRGPTRRGARQRQRRSVSSRPSRQGPNGSGLAR